MRRQLLDTVVKQNARAARVEAETTRVMTAPISNGRGVHNNVVLEEVVDIVCLIKQSTLSPKSTQTHPHQLHIQQTSISETSQYGRTYSIRAERVPVANGAQADEGIHGHVLKPRITLLRLLRRRLHDQIPHPTRDRLRDPMRTEVHGGQREDRAEIPGTAGTDDEPTSSRQISMYMIADEGVRKTRKGHCTI
ncbi:hypothetical protein VTL71DRAFT_15113 [Oculimacula yallundae]|uniref:Uncharacterized protein n=1 Tax=Oculimacula yallundae TaxID=86028 RepID=A0ABR4CFM7_9HELO